jgi:glycosyltransferase involved in cell wall biosynthesis
MFKIIIIGGPAENYVEKCITSILNQKEKNWEAQIIIDNMDNSYEIAKKYESNNLKIHSNIVRQYALSNLKLGIDKLNPNDDDIIVFVDLDDWFSNNNVLSIIKKYYDENKDLLITYGSWEAYPIKFNYPNNSLPYTKEDFNKGIRKVDWKGTALRTMKYKLWKAINDKDLSDRNGRYFKTAWDVAIMMPALEMAGFNRAQFIKEIVYIYNKSTPFSDDKLYLKEQRANKDYICSLPSYNFL